MFDAANNNLLDSATFGFATLAVGFFIWAGAAIALLAIA